MMFPAFNIRAQMQNKVLGVGFWEKASARRMQISKGRYIPVGDLVKLRLSPAIVQATISDSNIRKMNSKTKLVLRAQMRPHTHTDIPPDDEDIGLGVGDVGIEI
ncbi:hypothetical protein B484DRAFT_292400 [Ochromonadaceae sp. CCMP2298]|nr:hypothetical protein B484DRAFT_292400 [Ochromonadaceae sp. CCMP2298]